MRRPVLAAAFLVLALVAVVTLSARALGRRPPAEEPASSTTPPPPPASTCPNRGGVAIGILDDAQSVVNAHRAGTTYIVKAGIHLRNFSVRPKAGDTFCGEPGAVLDWCSVPRTAPVRRASRCASCSCRRSCAAACSGSPT